MPGKDSRFEQLEALSSLRQEGTPLRLHGSIGHAMMQGINLPPAVKHTGALRDIDLYHPSSDKLTLETRLAETEASSPQPLDAGLCSLLRKDGDRYLATKDEIQVELSDAGIFEETVSYEVPDSGGLILFGFNREAALAIHSLEPRKRIAHHYSDRQFAAWAQSQNVKLSPKLVKSIHDFHTEHRRRYPLAPVYEHLSQVYVKVFPESVRRKFRAQTHSFMKKHAGRVPENNKKGKYEY